VNEPSSTTTPGSSASAVSSHASPAGGGTPVDALPEIVAKAREAQRAWREESPYARITILRNVKDRILDRAAHVAKLLHEEVGKPEVEALLSEVVPSADVVEHWCNSIEELLDPIEVQLDRVTYRKKRGVVERDPRGLVAVVTPWSYPVALPLRTVVPALLAGNAVVLKPSAASPRAGALVAELFEGLLPAGLFAVVQGGDELGEALVRQEGIDAVVFTGSVDAGRKVAVACAERLVPCTLELGGKDAAIVLADANVERAARGVVWGALTNAGQDCASVERVYVEKAIADAFRQKVLEVVAGLRIGQDVGPLAPTVVDVGADDVPQGETVGPAIPLAVVEDADEAVRRANASRHGLTASVWTKKASRGEALARRLRARVVTVNNHAFTAASVSASASAIEALTRPRFVVVDRNRAARELAWYPYTDTLRTVALALAVLRSKTSSIVAKIAAFFRLARALPKRRFGS